MQAEFSTHFLYRCTTTKRAPTRAKSGRLRTGETRSLTQGERCGPAFPISGFPAVRSIVELTYSDANEGPTARSGLSALGRAGRSLRISRRTRRFQTRAEAAGSCHPRREASG